MEKEIQQKFLEYGQYLEEIRKKIYVLVIVLVLFFAAGFLFTNKILTLIIGLFKIENVTIAVTSPFQFIDLAVNTGILVAIIFCLPLAIYYFYGFIKDGLVRREKVFFLSLVPIGCLLFLVGFAYGFITLYFALKIIAQVNVGLGVVNLWDVGRFLSQIIVTSAFLGLIFEFPIVVTFLIRTNVINLNFLKSKRRYAYIFIIIFVALLPPTDGISLIIMSLPLLVIYEATILINRLYRPEKLLIN